MFGFSFTLWVVFSNHLSSFPYQHERERPVSAQSDDFVEGFRAGVRAKQEKERELHRESISESENILRRGLLESIFFSQKISCVTLVMFSSCFSLANGITENQNTVCVENCVKISVFQ